MPHIDYFFATLSPYTYLAGTRFEEVAAKQSRNPHIVARCACRRAWLKPSSRSLQPPPPLPRCRVVAGR